jgi:cytidylate kinase
VAAAIATIAHTERITFGYTPGEALPTRVSIGGEDVTAQIREARTSAAVSAVSALPAVRDALTAQQRDFGREHDTVMEGRDIGTVVFPAAEVKVFLTASAEERARRRVLQERERAGASAADAQAAWDAGELRESFEAVRDGIIRRDTLDAGRDVAPLVAADDAVRLDTTGMTIEQVVEKIAGLARM